ncbi:hypothetical protein V6N12_045509 [Hibiscus sabdariffa]|uniref:Uncharacterized protein n=1 Tax=Hibiscus sabdariffa TaxID=183260 RepID=A0ABR2G375_9ROSI
MKFSTVTRSLSTPSPLVLDGGVVMRVKDTLGGHSRRVEGAWTVLRSCGLRARWCYWLFWMWSQDDVYYLRRLCRPGLVDLRSGRHQRRLWGRYLRVDVATEEPTSFELRVSAIDQHEVMAEAVVSDQSQEMSMASPRINSPVERDGATSPCWHANQLWGLIALGRIVLHRLIWLVQMIGEYSRIGCEVWRYCWEHKLAYHAITILGPVVAAVVLVIGVAQGGARKVKLVNSLVEPLGSPVQQRVIVAAQSR